MTFTDDPTVSYVVERDIDLVLVQLLPTSSEFRRWFAKRLDLEAGSELEFLGVRQSVFTDNGESDVEVGFETRTGAHHAVLIENKIDASMQDRQAERYYERGENYLEDEWDAFSVCLVAPEGYVGQKERREFGSIVTYEGLMDAIESLGHDGTEFFEAMFERSLEKRIPADHSDLTAAIRQRILSKVDPLPELRVYQTSNTQVRLESTHVDHPPPVLYNAYIPGQYDGERAEIRVNLTGKESYSDETVSALQELFSENLESPAGFERRERPMDVVRKDIARDEFDSHEAYVESIATELYTLIDFYHGRLVESSMHDGGSGPS